MSHQYFLSLKDNSDVKTCGKRVVNKKWAIKLCQRCTHACGVCLCVCVWCACVCVLSCVSHIMFYLQSYTKLFITADEINSRIFHLHKRLNGFIDHKFPLPCRALSQPASGDLLCAFIPQGSHITTDIEVMSEVLQQKAGVSHGFISYVMLPM